MDLSKVNGAMDGDTLTGEIARMARASDLYRKSMIDAGIVSKRFLELPHDFLDSKLDDVLKRLQFENLLTPTANNAVLKARQDAERALKANASSLGLGSIQRLLQDVDKSNKQLSLPSDVLDIVERLNQMQERLGIGESSLSIIDAFSAVSLARKLGVDGIQEQLALVGIEVDGSMLEPSENPQSRIHNANWMNEARLFNILHILIALFGVCITVLLQTKSDAEQAQLLTSLQVQTQQIQSLMVIIDRAFVQTSERSEDRLMVRDRVATVRSQPNHGSAVEGRLLPKEQVQVIDQDSKWVEVEYYHWLHKEYRTGWILKKYLKRTPRNYSKPVGLDKPAVNNDAEPSFALNP